MVVLESGAREYFFKHLRFLGRVYICRLFLFTVVMMISVSALEADHYWYVNSLTLVEDPAGSGQYRVDYTFRINGLTVKRFYWELYVVESGCNATDGFTESFSGCTIQNNLRSGTYSGTLASGILLCPGKTYDAIMFTRRRGDCLSDNTRGSGGSNVPDCGAGCGDNSCGCPEDRASAATPLGVLTKFPQISGGDPANIWAGTPLNSLGDTPTYDGNWAYVRTTLSGSGLPDYNFEVDIVVDDCFGDFDQSFQSDETDGQVVFEDFGGAVAQVRCGAGVSVTYNADNTCGAGFPGNTFEVIDNSTIGGNNIGSGNVGGPSGPDINVDGRFEMLTGAIAVGNLCMDGNIELNLINAACTAENATDVTVQYAVEVLYPTSNFVQPTRVNCSDLCGEELVISGGPQWNNTGLNMGTATTLPIIDDPDDLFSFDWSGQVCTPTTSADACDSGSGSVKVDNCAGCGIYNIEYAITNDSCATCNTATTKQIQIVSPVIVSISGDIMGCGEIDPAVSFTVVECNPADGSPSATAYTGVGDRMWERSDMPGVFLPYNSPGAVSAGETVTFTPHWRYAGCTSCNATGTTITVTSLGMLELSCPTDNDLGDFNCSSLATIPAPPDSEATAEAAPYNMIIGNDPCGTIVVSSSDNASPDPCAGVTQTIIRTITVLDDLDGNGSQNGAEQVLTCQFSFDILPAFESPELVNQPGDVSIDCETPPLTTTLDYTNGGTNACLSEGMITSTLTTYPGICGGIMTETWTIPSSANCDRGDIVKTRTITIEEPDAPVVTCPADEIVECTSDISAGSPTVTTSCGTTSSTVVTGPTLISGDAGCPGTVYEISYAVTDECGTTTTCIQTFTIDNTSPTISAPADEDVMCAADITIGMPVTTTSCGLTGVVTTAGPALASGTADCPGATYAVMYTVTDDCGRASMATQIFTIVNAAPSMTCPGDMTVSCASDIMVGTPMTSASCGLSGNVVTSGPNLASGTADCPGATYVIEYTVTDGCGRSASCIQTFTIANLEPVIMAPADENVACAIDISVGVPTSTVSCSLGETITTSGPMLTTGTADCPGANYEIEYILTDACGRTSRDTQIFTIVNAAPTISCPADTTVSCLADIIVSTHTVSTSCGLSNTVTSIGPTLASGTADCPGATYIIVYTVEDGCGRTASCTQTFTIANDPPSITCPADTTVTCAADIVAGTATMTTSCTLVSTVTPSAPVLVSGDADCAGSMYQIMYTGSDDCGREVTCTQTFTLANDPPVITCMADTTVSCLSDVVAGTPSFSTSCTLGHGGISTVGPTLISGSDGCDGAMYEIMYSVTDDCGRSSSCVQTFTLDNNGPVMTTCPADQIIICRADIAVNTAGVIFTTDCGLTATVTAGVITPDMGNSACGELDGDTYTIIYTVEDECGRTATCTQTFMIDSSDPAVMCAPDIIVTGCNASDAPAPDPGLIFGSDGCGSVTVTFVGDVPSGGGCPGDTMIISRTYRVTNACGVASDCVQLIKIVDDIAPSLAIDMPSLNVSCDMEPPLPTIALSDNCSDPSDIMVVLRVDTTAMICPGDLMIVRTWIATDQCGNQDSAKQNIGVFDISDPTFLSAPADTIISCVDVVPASKDPIFDDNCGLAMPMMIESTAPGACPGELIITRTWTVEDSCMNVASFTQTIIVEDKVPPSIICPPEVIMTGCGVGDAPPVVLTDVMASDICSNVTITHEGDTQIGGGCIEDTLVISRRFRATDECGNFSECIQKIKIVDDLAPTMVTCPMDEVVIGCDAMDAPAPDISLVTASDNCTAMPTISHVSDTTTGGACLGDTLIITRTYRATDECGNFSDCIQLIKIVDHVVPVITFCPAPMTVKCMSDIPPAAPEDVIASDNCGVTNPATLLSTTDNGGLGCAADPFEVTYTYQVTDACGNITTCTHMITVIDDVDPVITTCPSDGIVQCIADIPDPHPAGVIATDNCGIANAAVTIDTTDSGTGCAADPFIRIYTYQVTDPCGNSTTCTQTYTVIDDTPPMITSCPANGTAQCVADIPAANPAEVTVADNCGIVNPATLINTSNSGTGCGADPYVRIYTYEVTDACGNASTCQQMYTVIDDTSPMITSCPSDGTAQCIADIPAADPIGVTATDNCGVVNAATLLSTTDTGTGCTADPFVRTYIYQVTDACGNKSTCEQKFRVIDDTPPVITSCPPGGTAQCEGDIPGPNPLSIVAMDNCGVTNPAVVIDTTDSGTGCMGDPFVRTYTYEVTDACGNATTCSETFTVIDDTDPMITSCPPDAQVQCISDIPDPTPGLVMATDNCGIPNPATVLDTVDSGTGCVTDPFIRVYTYQVTDACGNATTCTQAITVIDDTPPVITSCPTDGTAQCIADVPDPDPASVLATDNCVMINPATVIDTTESGTGCASDPFIRIYTYEITDVCGNATTCTQTFTVIDDTPPMITSCPSDGTAQCIADIPDPDPAAIIASDNCGITNAAITIDTTSSGAGCANDPYILLYTYEVTDACGNATTCTQTITVIDDTPPTITSYPPDGTAQCIADIPPADPSAVVATDNCGVVNPATLLFTSDNGGSGCAMDAYIRVYTYEVTDACGNPTTCTQTYTAIDDTPLVIMDCPADGTAQCIAEIPAPEPSGVTAMDNCGVVNPATLLSTNTSGTGCVSDPYILVYIYQITDACGNTATCQQQFTVIDDTPPVINTCPIGGTVQCIADIPAATPASVSASDNCGVVNPATLLNTADNGGAGCTSDPFILTYTYEVTDPCGNATTCTQVWTVIDDTPPTIIQCPEDGTAQCIDDIPDPTPLIVVGMDNCGIVNVATVIDTTNSGTGCAGDPYIRTYTYELTDACGNTRTCTQTYTVIDDTPPTITSIPADGTAQCIGDIPDPDPAAVSATDNCGAVQLATVIDTSDNGGTGCSMDPYVLTYTYQITDPCGNASTATQTYIVVDDTSPMITCPPDIIITGCNVTAAPPPDISSVAVSDNCMTPTVTFISDIPSGGGCAGDTLIIERTYRVTDQCGATVDCVQLIKIVDDELPVLTGVSDMTVDCNDDINNLFEAWINNHGGSTAADNCNLVTWSTIPADPVLDPSTPTCVTFVASDLCGNATTMEACFNVNCSSIEKEFVQNLDQDGSMDISVGDSLVYEITFTNNGSTTLTDVVVTDDLIDPNNMPCDVVVAGGTCVLRGYYVVIASDIINGMVINTATGVSNETPIVEDDIILPVATPSISIVKGVPTIFDDVDGSTDMSVGDIIEYQVIATNNGTSNLTDVEVTDPMISPDIMICGLLMPGEPCILTGRYTITAMDLANGSIANTASVDSDQTMPIDDDQEIDLPMPAMSIIKSQPTNADNDNSGDVSIGDVLTYLITLTNTGEAALTNVVITDNSTTQIGGTSPCLVVQPMETCTFIGEYIITAGDISGTMINEITNVTTGTSDQAPPVVDSTKILVPNPSMDITKSSGILTSDNDNSGDISVGDELTFTITLTNNGNANLIGVQIVDPTLTPDVMDCGTLMMGQSCELIGVHMITEVDLANGAYENVAVGSSDIPIVVVMDTSDVILPSPVHTMSKSTPVLVFDADMSGDISAGDSLEYTITVTNTGTANLTDVMISDARLLPTSMTCMLLEPSETCILVGRYQIQQSDLGTTLDNTALSDTRQTDEQMDDADIIIPAPALQLEKSEGTLFADLDNNGIITPGDTIEYVIVATNIGTANLTNVSITDDLISPNATTCPLLMPTETCVLTGYYVVTQDDMNLGMISNTAVGDSDQTEEEADDTMTLLPFIPELSIDKSIASISVDQGVNSDLIDPDDIITFEYVVTNLGLVTMNNIMVNDPGPFFGGLPGTNELSSIDCGVATLTPGMSTTCMATYVISQDDFDNAVGLPNGIRNAANVSGEDPRGDIFVSDADVAIDSIPDGGAIEIIKVAGPLQDTNGDGILWVGDELTYTFTVTNVGNTRIGNIVVTDDHIVGPITCEGDALDPGESFTCTATYILTEDDGAAGEIVNTAVVDGVTPTGRDVSDVSDDPTDPTTDENDPTVVLIPCPSISCPAQINLSLSASDPFEVTPEVVGLPTGFLITLLDEDGNAIPGNIIDCSFSSISITYTAQHPCRPTACWGNINIETKGLPETTNTKHYISCGEDEPLLTSLGDLLKEVYARGCYAPLRDIRASYQSNGDGCDGGISVRTVSATADLDGTKSDIVLHVDSIISEPLVLDSILCPKSDEFSISLNLVCRQAQNFPDVSPESIFQMTDGEIPSAFPYINTGRQRIEFDTVTIIDTIIERLVEDTTILLDGYWVELDLVLKDTVFRDRVLSIPTPILIPIRPGTTCNITTKYDDVTYDGCLGPDTKTVRTWSVLDWCTGQIKTCVQWIIVIDDTPPLIEEIPDDLVSIAPWTCTATYLLPEPEIEEDCTRASYVWRTSAGDIDEGSITDLWLGEGPVLVELIVTDDCLNERIDTFYVTVVDSTAPVAIAKDRLNVSLVKDTNSDDGITKVFISEINQDSHDAGCNEVTYCTLLEEELNNPIIRGGVHLRDDDGHLIYYPAQCAYDGIYSYGVVIDKVRQIEEIAYVICKDFVKFCCADLGLNRVALVVSDTSSYSPNSISWSIINVEDKSLAAIQCDERFIKCGQSILPDDIGYPDLSSIVCKIGELTYEDATDIDACGVGVIERTWYYEGAVECTERIYLEEKNVFDPYTIKWPKHYTGEEIDGVRRECEILLDEDEEPILDSDGLEQYRIVEYPESISMGAPFECSTEGNIGEPAWCPEGCTLIAANFESLEVEASEACKKIIKRWTLIDWCTWDANGSDPDDENDSPFDSYQAVDDEWLDASDPTSAGKWTSIYHERFDTPVINFPDSGSVTKLSCASCDKAPERADYVYFRYTDVDVDGYYTYDQVIKIIDNTAPVLDAQSSYNVDVLTGASSKEEDFDDCVGTGYIRASASDFCLNDSLDIGALSWTIYVIDTLGGLDGDAVKLWGDSVSISVTGSAYDRRSIIWNVSDSCGNSSSTTTQVYFKDTKQPTPLCIQDLSSTNMDPNGTATIWAKDYDLGSFDNCSEVQLMFKYENGDYTPALAVDCQDIANGVSHQLSLALYAIDAEGNSDFCNVTLRVDDQIDVCEDLSTGSTADVDGNIITSDGQMVESAMISINTGEQMLTVEDGVYAFSNLPMYKDYAIEGYKNDDTRNGISSIDLLLIQRHILSISPIEDPYLLIAADVNDDRRISSLDLVELRRILLGLSDEFSNNTSWRFVDPDQGFENPSYPWPLKEDLDIDFLERDVSDADMLGIKIGDINGTVRANGRLLAGSRSKGVLKLESQDHVFEKGDVVELKLENPSLRELAALQFTMRLDGLEYVGATSGVMNITDKNFAAPSQDYLTFAWYEGGHLDDATLFTMTFVAQVSGLLSESIMMLSSITPSLAYDADSNEYEVSHTYNSLEIAEKKAELYQNEPNPFKNESTIDFYIPSAGSVVFTFYDISGRKVLEINRDFEEGDQSILIKKEALSGAGIIYYQMNYDNQQLRRRMVIID